MPKKPEGMEQLLVEELQDLYDAEKQLVRALPKMAKAATDEQLEGALREHLEVTRGHVQRLERAFEAMGMRARSKPCKGMKGIVEEGSEMLQEGLSEALLDSAISSGARKVEHYEMMGYESASALARQLGRRDVAELMQATLQEEAQADRELARLSKRLVKEASRFISRESGGKATASRRAPRRAAGKGARPSRRRAGNRVLTDPTEIRRWAEERGGQPACVKGTGGRGDTGVLRIDFPGYTGKDTLQQITWTDWGGKFEERNLALIVQDQTADGRISHFNKLVSRDSVEGKPMTRGAH